MVATAALLAAGCGGDDDLTESDVTDVEAPMSAGADNFEMNGEMNDDMDGNMDGDMASDDAGGAAPPSSDVAQVDGIDLGQVGRDVIVEMFVSISSDDVQRSVATVSARAAALGGGVASSEVDYGSPDDEFERGHAVLVVKVPPSAVDDLLTGLEQAGTVRSINQSAQDVTEQLVDLDVRIANARQSVQNVRGFMERATDLNELVSLESELTRRQTELERLEAQQRNLSDRVALSTVTVEIVSSALVPSTDDDSLADGLRRGWNGFLGVVWAALYGIAVLLPFLVVGALAALVARPHLRRVRQAAKDSAATGAPLEAPSATAPATPAPDLSAANPPPWPTDSPASADDDASRPD